MKNCEVIKPFVGSYEVSPSEADFSSDSMIEKDGLVVKARKHFKRVVGKVRYLSPSFEDTYKKDDQGNYVSNISGMEIVVQDGQPFDVRDAGSGVLSLPDEFAERLESKGLVRVV